MVMLVARERSHTDFRSGIVFGSVLGGGIAVELCIEGENGLHDVSRL
jgi:hypothetical protein